MTSVNNFDINKEISTNDQEKSTIEESSNLIDIKNEEETIVVSNEKPITSEEEEEENEMDTQPLLEQPIILEGKRSRRPTLRLEITELTPTKKELLIPQGHGKPLGEIEYINYKITHASTDALFRMRNICFGRRGNKSNMRKNLREFKGFEFQQNSNEYEKHLNNLTKLKKDQLRSISNILGLSSTGRNNDHAKRILNFLIEPYDEGKRIPGKKLSIRQIKKISTDSNESNEIKNGNSHDEKLAHKSNYVYKPGKKSLKNYQISSDKNQNEDELIKLNENEEAKILLDKYIFNDNKIEKTDRNEEIINNIVQDTM